MEKSVDRKKGNVLRLSNVKRLLYESRSGGVEIRESEPHRLALKNVKYL